MTATSRRRFAPAGASPQPLSGIDQPSNALIVVEHSYRFADTGPYLGYTEPSDPTNTDEVQGPSSWNSGHGKNSCNIVYMDGHAKYRHLIDTFTEVNGINQWRYNKAHLDAINYPWGAHASGQPGELPDQLT